MVGAQNSVPGGCTTESLLQKPGTWKESSNRPSGISATDLAKEKKIVGAIHAMIKSKYSPKGVYAEFNGAYSSPRTGEEILLKQPTKPQLIFQSALIGLMLRFMNPRIAGK